MSNQQELERLRGNDYLWSQIGHLIRRAEMEMLNLKDVEGSRELSTAFTNLQTARMWFDDSYENHDNKIENLKSSDYTL
jgi:hypothetical protein